MDLDTGGETAGPPPEDDEDEEEDEDEDDDEEDEEELRPVPADTVTAVGVRCICW